MNGMLEVAQSDLTGYPWPAKVSISFPANCCLHVSFITAIGSVV